MAALDYGFRPEDQAKDKLDRSWDQSTINQHQHISKSFFSVIDMFSCATVASSASAACGQTQILWTNIDQNHVHFDIKCL